MADITNEEIEELVKSIKERTDKDISSETIRTWSREDVDRLLEATRKGNSPAAWRKDAGSPVYASSRSYSDAASYKADAESGSFAEVFEENAADENKASSDENTQADNSSSDDTGSSDGDGDYTPQGIKAISADIGVRVKAAFSGIRKSFFRFRENEPEKSVKTAPEADGEETGETDDDVKIADFSASRKKEQSSDGGKTKHISLKGDDPQESEDVTSSSPVSEEAVTSDEGDGQLVFDGFSVEESPSIIDSDDAEAELDKVREKKAGSFTVTPPADELYDSDYVVERLMKENNTPKKAVTVIKNIYNGPKYTGPGDVKRVKRSLKTEEKEKRTSIIILGILFLFSVLTSLLAVRRTTMGGDKMSTILLTFIYIAAALLVSGKSIFNDFSHLKDRGITIRTMTGFTAIVCFLQTFVMFITYFFHHNNVSVFGCAGIILLLFAEISDYVTLKRTTDAFLFCVDNNRDKLYSLESVTDDNDISTVLRTVNSKSSRIKFPCKIGFPSELLALCSSETGIDKKSGLLSVIVLLFSVICLIISAIVSGSITIGLGAFTACLCLSVPAFAVLLVQMPLRHSNLRLNKSGGLISCQESVSLLNSTNVIMFNGSQLFDPKASRVIEIKDFGKMHGDDARLYAAAMAIHANGPLSPAFERIVDNLDALPTIKQFTYEEKMGVTGLISGQRVCFGNRSLMENHSVFIPDEADEDRYVTQGFHTFYLAVGGQLVCMPIVEYAADKKISKALTGLDANGVSILVSSTDPNVTSGLISNKFDYDFSNLFVADSTVKRVVNNYVVRKKSFAKAYYLHNGTPGSMLKVIYESFSLRRLFKTSEIISFISTAMGCIISVCISAMDVMKDTPAIAIMIIQCVLSLAPVGIIKILYKK